MDLSDAIARWETDLHRSVLAGNMSPVTESNYRRDIGELLTIAGDQDLTQLGPDQLNDIFDSYSARIDARYTRRTPSPKGRSRATLARFYATCSVFFNDAQKRGWVAASPLPMTYLARGKTRATQDPKRKSVGVPGAMALLNQRLTARDEFILRVLIEAGPRVGELCAANHTDLAIGDDGIWWLRLEHTKSGKARRVPLSPGTVKSYQAYRDTEMPRAQARPGKPGTLVDSEAALLRSRRGRRMTPRDIQNLLARTGTRAGVRVTPHGLRHTAATVLLESGADIHVVRDLLGHSNITVTSAYLDGNDIDVAAAVLSSPLAAGASIQAGT